MMVVFVNRNRDLTVAEQEFNRRLIGVRQMIERCIGLLKMRFRCLLGERKMRYHPTKAGNIIYSCVVLHNYLAFNRFDLMHDIDELQNFENINNHLPAQNLPLRNDRQQQQIRNLGENRRNQLAVQFQNAA